MFINTVTFLCRPFRALLECLYSQGLRPGLICSAPLGLRNQSREAAAQNSPGREPWVKGRAM